jgi:tyrosine aminotransferase
MLTAREAVVEKYSTETAPFTTDEVIMTFGCSGALYTALSAVCEEGDNILMPRPGFPLCHTICENLNVNVKFYDLDPNKEFEIVPESVESLIDE